jgi:hypothetical protein
MAAPFLVCTKREQISVICSLLWAESVQGAEIHTHLCVQYEANALFQKSVYKWIKSVQARLDKYD